MDRPEKEKIAAMVALLLHLDRDSDNFNQGRKMSNVWALEHRRRIMGLKGVRESKQSRTTWR